jgi:hypothetical protein
MLVAMWRGQVARRPDVHGVIVSFTVGAHTSGVSLQLLA